MTEPVLPVIGGDWVASKDGHAFQVGRVRAAYFDHAQVLIDLVLYSPDGDKVGRTSPHCGGPRSFEPALEFANFRRIEEPNFPIERIGRRVPSKEKKGWSTLHYDYDASVKPKAVRIKAVKRRQRAANFRNIIFVTKPDRNLDKDREVGALRRAAQELRDLARQAPSTAKLIDRAVELEREAISLGSA